MFYLPTNYTHQLTADEASAIHKISKDYALIIDNKKFKSLRYRAGSDEDVESIKDFCKPASITIHKDIIQKLG